MSCLAVFGTVVCEDVESPAGVSPPPPSLGGSGVYAAVSAQLLRRVHMVGAVGTDFPEPYRRCLESLNIDLGGLEVKPGKTMYWRARYAEDLTTRETLALDLGVYEDYHPHVSTNIQQCSHALIANLMPRIQDEVLAQLDRPNLTLLGTIDHWVRTARSGLAALLPRATGFIANAEEMMLFTDCGDPIEAAEIVARLGSRFVVVTLADQGALLVWGGKAPAGSRVPVSQSPRSDRGGRQLCGRLPGQPRS